MEYVRKIADAIWRGIKFVARWIWKVVKAVVLIISYVFLFLPTLVFRSHKKRKQRHAELIAAIKSTR